MKDILSSIVGHEPIKQRLSQLVSKQKLPNTVILSGSSSIGKYKVALGVAQAVMCRQKQGDLACGLCGSCLRVAKEQHENLRLVKSAGGLIKVDQARAVTQFLSKKNNADEFKVVIIDESEHLNNQSANALLKTLEEPPKNCFIILVTSSLNQLLPTIRSRGQIFRFGELTTAQIKQISGADEWLVELSGANLQTIDKLQDSSYQEIYMNLSHSIANLGESNYNASINLISAYTKNKTHSLILIQALQGLFHSSYKNKLGFTSHPIEWQDLAKNKLMKLSKSTLMDLFNESVQMESQLKANFDVLLSFESLYLKLINYFSQEVQVCQPG